MGESDVLLHFPMSGARELAAQSAMHGVLFFAGIYFSLVEEFSASSSGLRLLFYLPGLGGMRSCLFIPPLSPSHLLFRHSLNQK